MNQAGTLTNTLETKYDDKYVIVDVFNPNFFDKLGKQENINKWDMFYDINE